MGWEFIGWTNLLSGATNRAETLSLVADAPQRFAAVFAPRQYVIAYDANGAEGTMPMQVCDTNAVYSLQSCAFVTNGVRFTGWRCSNGNRYDDGMLIFNLAQPGETVTMKAIWE